MNQSGHEHREDIDGLRGIAVLSVIGFHVGLRSMSGGFVGVDVFFVISGFLISTIIFEGLEKNRFSFAEFYARRIRRIFPALILVLIAVWTFGWFALLPDEYRELSQHIEAGAGFLSNILLWKQSGYFARAAALKPLLHLWSLGIEEQYYLVWPLALSLIWKTKIRFLGILLLIVSSFALNVGTETIVATSATTFYLPHTRVWELLIGSALAYVQLYRSDRLRSILVSICKRISSRGPCVHCSPLRNIITCLGLLLVGTAVVKLDSTVVFPGYAALLPTIGAALIIAGGPASWVNRYILGSRVLVFVGLISYPLYLWHWPLLWGLRMLRYAEPSFRSQSIAVGCAFLLAWMTYRFVEKPIRQKHGLFSRANRAIPLLVGGMLAVCALGVFSAMLRGVPERFSGECRQLMNYKEDEHVSGWRSETCFLDPDQDWRSFRPECIDEQPKGAPLVFLWGDSHAADVYPGIRKLQSQYVFRLAQFNASSCPPILNFDHPRRKHCRDINDHVFQKIVELRPETVLLVAQVWSFPPTDTHAKIFETIAALRKAGIQRVVVVGPNPDWKVALPRLCLGHCKIDLHHQIPDRTASYLNDGVIEADPAFGSWVASIGAVYVSPTSILCNSGGCLTRVQMGDRTDLVSFDQHHLTTVASEFIAEPIVASVREILRPRLN